MRAPRTSLLAFAVIILAAGVAGAQSFGETVIERGVLSQDTYLAGRIVEVAAEVEGDVVAAGQRVTLGRRIAGDVAAVAELVEVDGRVGDDIRAAGRNVVIDADVAGHVVAAGMEVSLGSGGSVGDWAWLRGDTIQVLGDVGGELKAAGRRVTIGGTVGGDARIEAEEIRLLDGARIEGRLVYTSSKEPRIADGAVVQGPVERIERPETEEPRKMAEEAGEAAAGVGIVFALGLLVAGSAYLLAFPGFSAAVAQTGIRRFWSSLGLGLAMLLGVPFVAVLLLITIIGVPLGLAAFALYAVLLLFGYLNGVAVLARGALSRWRSEAAARRWPMLASFAAALILILLLQLVPLLGQLLALAVLLMGIGSLVMEVGRLYRQGSGAAARP